MTGGLRRLGAARRRAADRGRARPLRGRRDRRGRPRPRRAPLRRRGDRPGLRERALAPRVRDLRRLRRRAAVRPVARDAHRAQGPARRATTMLAIARLGVARLARRRDHDDGRLQLLGRGRDRRRRARAARDRLPRGLRRRPGRRASGSSSEKRAPRRRRRELVRIGISPHAPYTCSLDIYRWCLSLGIPVGTHLAESANENEWLEHGSGPLAEIAPLLVPPTGKRAGRDARARARPGAPLRALRRGRRRRDRAARRTRRARRPLPALERPARLRHRAARRAARRGRRASGSAPTRPPRRRRSTCSRRCAPRSTWPGPASGARTRCWPPTRCALATLDAARALRTRRRGGYPDARQARRPDGRLARREARTIRSRIPRRRSSSAARRNECSRRSSTDRPATARTKTTSSGERYAAPQAPPGSECSRRGRSRARSGTKQRRRSGRSSCSSSGSASTRSGRSSSSRSCSCSASCSSASAPARPASADVLQNAFNFGSAAAARRSRACRRRSTKHPQDATGLARPRDRLRGRSSARRTRSARSQRTRRCARRTRTRSRSSPSQYATLAQHLRDRLPERADAGAAIGLARRRRSRRRVDVAVRQGIRRPERRSRTRSPRPSQSQALDEAADRLLELPDAPSRTPRRPTRSSRS